MNNNVIENTSIGKGLYLRPYKTGSGLKLRIHADKKKTSINLPNRPLTNVDLTKYVKILNITHFRGVFMRNALPSGKPKLKETAIINLDDKSGPGTHWVAYRKLGKDVTYFDSFGNLKPPKELINYLGVEKVK